MDGFEAARVVFDCEPAGHSQWSDGRHATIEIEIGVPRKDNVGDTAFKSTIRLRVGGLQCEVQRVLYGYEIRGFAQDLRQMYEALDGSARLQDWDAHTLLCFTVVDRARGRIAVGGRLAPVVIETSVASEDHFITNILGHYLGVEVAFEGFWLDQTYLKAPLSSILRFVEEHSTQCEATGGYPPPRT